MNRLCLMSSQPPSVIKMAFYIEGESSYDDVSFYYAHWTMSFSTLQSLKQSVINTSTELKTNYNNYLNASTRAECRNKKRELHLIVSFVPTKNFLDI